MVDLTEGMGDWISFTPDLKATLANGKKFDNRKTVKKDQISMEIRILTHKQKSHIQAIDKTLLTMEVSDATALDQKILEENVRFIKNLVHKGKNIVTGKDFYETQTTGFVQYIKSFIMSDTPLRKEDVGN